MYLNVKDLELLRVTLKDSLYGEGEVDLLESNIHYYPPKVGVYISDERVSLYYIEG